MKIDANLILREQGVDALRSVIDSAVPFKGAAPMSGSTINGAAAPKVEIASLPPLTLDEWRNRDLPEPDLLMGYWLTTTTRALFTAATGLGKTNYGMAVGMRAAAGLDFLHWKAARSARVLVIDGEMSRQLLQERLRAGLGSAWWSRCPDWCQPADVFSAQPRGC